MRLVTVPFRWNTSNPRLGNRLGRGQSLRMPATYKEELLRSASEVLRLAGDVDLVFVGRSLENFYDLLTGALAETTWRERVQLFQVSLRRRTPGQLRRELPGALGQLWLYAHELHLTPPQILQRTRPVTFVDVVHTGQTLGNLQKVLRHWCQADPRRWPEIRGRLSWVCLVERGHPDYEPWELSDSSWTRDFAQDRVTRVWLDWRTWRYLAEDQLKTTDSHIPTRWGHPSTRRPPADELRLRAARTGRALYKLGGWSRRRLAKELERPPAPEPWRASLIRELWSSA